MYVRLYVNSRWRVNTSVEDHRAGRPSRTDLYTSICIGTYVARARTAPADLQGHTYVHPYVWAPMYVPMYVRLYVNSRWRFSTSV